MQAQRFSQIVPLEAVESHKKKITKQEDRRKNDSYDNDDFK